MALGPDDLVACHWMLTGAAMGELARWPFEERVAAAARAGYKGIGTRYDEYAASRASGLSDADMRAILDRHGIVLQELEFVYGWSSDDGEKQAEARRIEGLAYQAADALGAHHLNVGCSEALGALAAVEAVAERFAGLCDRAAEHGLKVAIEFMPWTGIPDAAKAWEVVRFAGRPNGGLLVDSWHYFRGAAEPSMLRPVPADRIVALQIDDADAAIVGSMSQDTRRRRLPGDGSFDLDGFVRLLDEIGVRGPYGVEIISDARASLPLDEALGEAYKATRTVLDRARRTRVS